MAEQTKRQQLETHLTLRANQDPDFRERLLGDPKRTIEEEIGMTFPEGLQVSVHEEKVNHLHVVLQVGLLADDDLTPGSPRTEVPEVPFWKRWSRQKAAGQTRL